MNRNLRQFNSSECVFGNKNVLESFESKDDIVFNESYIVIGSTLEGESIHATYDLTVLGDVIAQKLTVNGSLFVQGDIKVNELFCQGSFICTGDIKAKDLSLGPYSVVGSIKGESLHSSGDLYLKTTVDTDKELKVNGFVVAGEGILGAGTFNAKAAVANEYFEFYGKHKSKVFEISGMKFTEGSPETSVEIIGRCDAQDVNIATECFNKSFNEHLISWGKLEEDDFIRKIREISAKIDDLHMVDRIVDRVIALSYEREIDNFCDFLYLLCARNVFPKGLYEYETIEPVLRTMYEEARVKVASMDYRANKIEEFVVSLYALHKYHKQLPIGINEGADKVFSSIGIRYSTVEHIWRNQNE